MVPLPSRTWAGHLGQRSCETGLWIKREMPSDFCINKCPKLAVQGNYPGGSVRCLGENLHRGAQIRHKIWREQIDKGQTICKVKHSVEKYMLYCLPSRLIDVIGEGFRGETI